MALNTRQAETCTPGCAQCLREDRRSGLIYGPYAVEAVPTGTREFVQSYVFAAATGKCTYCGGDLPRHRARLLLRRFVPERLAAAVVQYW